MPKLTPKENYLRLARGELPEWIPGGMPYKDHGFPNGMVGPLTMWVGQSELKPRWMQPQGYWKDLWGANYMWRPGDMAGIPDPNNFALKDLSKWRDVVKAPPAPEFDWEAMAKEELAPFDRSQVAISIALGFQPFQQVVALMGFNETLTALYEEPETVKELLNYMADWYVPIVKKIVDHYRPDMCAIADDTAAKDFPFFSPATYEDVFKPIYAKVSKPVTETGAPIDFHNCGRCEGFVGHMIDFGVRYWNPAQSENDLAALKKKYGNKIAICGGWDAKLPITATEEQTREAVRAYIDRMAPGGGFVYSAFVGNMNFGADLTEEEKKDNEIWQKINGWMTDELYNYGTGYYDR